MSISHKAPLIAAVVSLGGCSIHPLPDDVTGVTTFNIVKQIRCEARQAIFDFAVDWLIGPKNHDPEAKQIGLEFKEGLRSVSSLNYTLFKGGIRQIVQLFFNTGVAYNFQLDMTETNNIDPTVDILTFSGKNQFTSPVNGVADRIRENTRTFTVTDTFAYLLRDIPDQPGNNYCDGHIVGPNYIYPAVGKIGMDRMIGDFVNLTLFGGLAGTSSAGSPNVTKGPPTMVDQLKFTTTVSLGATPKVVFSPLRTFMDASVALKATRQDVHTVTVGLAIDANSVGQVAQFRAGVFVPGPLGALLSASPATNSELAAVLAVNQVLTQQVFKPTITINSNQ
jgi:hypothetical protein